MTHGEFPMGPRASRVAIPKLQAPRRMAKPGCTAADETILVMGHLQGVAEGKTSGVLALDAEHLERAALGAEGMGDKELAGKLRGFKGVLPGVREAASAQAAIARLKPLADETWELGVKCGGYNLAPASYARAVTLAKKVEAGEITKEQAVQALQQGI